LAAERALPSQAKYWFAAEAIKRSIAKPAAATHKNKTAQLESRRIVERRLCIAASKTYYERRQPKVISGLPSGYLTNFPSPVNGHC
jgi:hypothetical protein